MDHAKLNLTIHTHNPPTKMHDKQKMLLLDCPHNKDRPANKKNADLMDKSIFNVWGLNVNASAFSFGEEGLKTIPNSLQR